MQYKIRVFHFDVDRFSECPKEQLMIKMPDRGFEQRPWLVIHYFEFRVNDILKPIETAAAAATGGAAPRTSLALCVCGPLEEKYRYYEGQNKTFYDLFDSPQLTFA